MTDIPQVRCNTPYIRESEIRAAFLKAFNEILGDKGLYIDQFEKMLPLLG